MFPMNWKLFIVGTLSVSVLAACGDHKSKSKDNSSPFAGYWLNEDAAADYEFARKSGGNADDIFCRRVMKHPTVHGLPETQTWDTGLDLQAYLVTKKGDIYAWDPNLSPEDMRAKDQAYWGHVRGDGFVVADGAISNSSPAAGTSFQGSGYQSAISQGNTGSLMLDDRGHLQVYHNGANGQRNGLPDGYSRIAEVDLRNYTAWVERCGKASYKIVAPQAVAPRGRLPERYPVGQAGPGPAPVPRWQDDRGPGQAQVAPAPEAAPLPTRKGS